LSSSENRIKLLVITPSLRCGGSEKYVSLFCNHIYTQQFDVTLLVLNNSAPFYQITNPAIKIIDLKAASAKAATFSILKTIKKVSPHILYSTANHVNILLMLLRPFFAKRIVTVARESSIISSNIKNAAYPKLLSWATKKYYRYFDCIICQSIFMQEDLVAHYNVPANKTIVINNPVESTAHIHAQKLQPVKLITVARLTAAKGIERLIEAVATLKMPYQYFIIGDGELRASLQLHINNLQLQQQIFLVGEKQQPFYGNEDATLYLSGSYYEGFPNAVLEAQALGIPVVTFNMPGGISEIINNDNGAYAADDSATAFAAAIQKALHTNFDRAAIATHTAARFNIDSIIKETSHLLQQLFATHKK
jgi:glycosyltransferase involved in cell wall biosynthesis